MCFSPPESVSPFENKGSATNPIPSFSLRNKVRFRGCASFIHALTMQTFTFWLSAVQLYQSRLPSGNNDISGLISIFLIYWSLLELSVILIHTIMYCTTYLRPKHIGPFTSHTLTFIERGVRGRCLRVEELVGV